MLKIGLVLASAGSPVLMPALFEAGFPEDAVWLILLRHAPANLLECFAEALEEMTGRRVRLAKEPAVLHGGDIWVLPSETEFTLLGNKLQPVKEKGPLHLDRFFLNLCDAKASLACVLLTAPELESQGSSGLKALHRAGAQLYAIDGVTGPARQALATALKEDWLSQSLPVQGALSKVQFGRTLPEPMATH